LRRICAAALLYARKILAATVTTALREGRLFL